MLLNIRLRFYVALIWNCLWIKVSTLKIEYLSSTLRTQNSKACIYLFDSFFWGFFCVSLPIVPSAFTYLQCCHSWKWVRLSWMYHFPIEKFPLKSYALLFRFFNQRTKLVSSSTWCKTSQLCSHYYADFYLSPTKCWLPSLTAYIFHHKLPH